MNTRIIFIGYSTVGSSYYQQTAPKAASNTTGASDPNSQYVYQQTAYNPYFFWHFSFIFFFSKKLLNYYKLTEISYWY